MKDKPVLKRLILISAAYLAFVLIDLAIDSSTGIRWTSPRDFNDILSLIALGLLWIWYFTDKIRRK